MDTIHLSHAAAFLNGISYDSNRENVPPAQTKTARVALPLIEAVRSESLREVSTILRNNKYCVNLVDEDDRTALHHAIDIYLYHHASFDENKKQEMLNIIKLLFANRGWLNVYHRDCPLKKAALEGQSWYFVNMFAEKFPESLASLRWGDVPFLHLVIKEHPGIFEKVALAAPPAAINEELRNVTLLHRATNMGYFDAARILIERGADINAKDEYNTSPLAFSILNGHTRITRLLLESGAQIHEMNSHEQNILLRYAVIAGNWEMAELLIQAGMPIDHRDINGFTILHHAAFSGRIDRIRFLLAHGADTTITDNLGRTSAEVAKHSGRVASFRILVTE
ncbi:MAG: hypothetical protein A3F09_02290 [Chlamydiae bacterium RIFCSPHIGHO2_12_FULL_49_11]|nr:MAG: hypothetical protein A3F09_02290 [Chlamydiae bacterium RIFCSPHIGHO2_12_FULL_49_11]